MAEVTLEQRFHGTCNLVILHLRRAAKSNDLEEGFRFAREAGMLKPEQERFIRECFAIDEAGGPASEDLITRLQSCVLSLNTADPA